MIETLSMDMVLRLLERVRRKFPIDESEAALLLRVFAYTPARTVAEREERIDDTITADESLKWAALHYGKDTRTIRSWCKKGFFPSAFRTVGGHWRIPFDARTEAEKHLPGFVRKPKNILGSRQWAELKSRLQKLFLGMLVAFETDAGIRDIGSKEFRSRRPRQIADEAVKAEIRAYKEGALPYLRLRLAARRIRVDSPNERITTGKLASELGMSVAGLYRYSSADKIRSAIKQSEQPLKPSTMRATKEHSIGEVATMFAELEGFSEYGNKLDETSLVKRTPTSR